MNRSMTVAIASLALLIGACGSEQAPAPAAPAAAPVAAAAPTPPAAPAPGESTYKSTCALCHASGAGGAPIPGDQADWGPRIAQGKEVLYQHALAGFTGQKGVMPARGTGMALSDQQIQDAVDYMVAKAE